MECTLRVNIGILSAIGNTPLVKLERVLKHIPVDLYAKLELYNPGGSIKDRPAVYMLEKAFERGDIDAGTTIIESSSGNLGIGLAQACRYFGLRFLCVVDLKTTTQNIKILEAYGAELDIVRVPDPHTGEFLHARINRVKELLDSIPNSYWCNQYANVDNANAHHQTMHEIVMDLNGPPDYLFCATSSCGTLRGCAEYIRKYNLPTKLLAVDALGSVIFGTTKCKRLIPGHGAAQVPQLLKPGLEDAYTEITDLDCVAWCRRLLAREAILAGGSSGGIIAAIEKKAPELQAGATCVALLCDRGERYLDTIYSDQWVREHFGSVFHLWEK